tara:strand:+ start:482 stop:1045 length:564 start_codon:yes stop_codon:yes gene_type:complete
MAAVTEYEITQLSDLAARNPLYRQAYENAVMQMQIQNQMKQVQQLSLAPSDPSFDTVEEALSKFIDEDQAVQDLITEDLRHNLWAQGVKEGLDVNEAANRALVAMHDPAFESLFRSTHTLSQKMREGMPITPEIVCEWVSIWFDQAEKFPSRWIMCVTCDRYPSRKGFSLCEKCITQVTPVPTVHIM